MKKKKYQISENRNIFRTYEHNLIGGHFIKYADILSKSRHVIEFLKNLQNFEFS